jgi:hypothetical protein
MKSQMFQDQPEFAPMSEDALNRKRFSLGQSMLRILG